MLSHGCGPGLKYSGTGFDPLNNRPPPPEKNKLYTIESSREKKSKSDLIKKLLKFFFIIINKEIMTNRNFRKEINIAHIY